MIAKHGVIDPFNPSCALTLTPALASGKGGKRVVVKAGRGAAGIRFKT